jgi:hypothetical protein
MFGISSASQVGKMAISLDEIGPAPTFWSQHISNF